MWGVICRQLNATGDRQGKREIVKEEDIGGKGRKAAICASFNEQASTEDLHMLPTV